MSQYYFGAPHVMTSQSPFPANMSSHNHHGNRPRRSTRFTATQTAQKQPKNSRTQKDSAEAALTAAIRKDYEAARSFDLEDDEIFCPWHLLTDDDLQSIHSASSDRSSISSGGSPETSPLQPQLQPTQAFSLTSGVHHSMPSTSSSSSSYQQGAAGHLKLHQPLAQRTRNAIPIVDPNSRHTSPPTSLSPARQAQKNAYLARRW